MTVARCLRKSPADRYQSAGHLIADLRRCGLAQPDGPPPTSTGHKALPGWLRGRQAQSSLGAGLALIIVILGL